MKTIGQFNFPETAEEVEAWVAYEWYHALSSTALAAAHTHIEGTWRAYCRGVPGIDHTQEYQEVLRHGDQLDEQIARAIFPEFEGVPYAR